MCSLDELRRQIDKIDDRVIELLNERAGVVMKVGELKRNTADAPPVYAPDRERVVLDKIKAVNKGPLLDKCLVAIYREIMSGSFFLERPLRAAYLGPKGSFSHNAAMLKFGQCVEYRPQADIHGVFDEITHGHCDLGIVPVQNTIAGGIIETLDSLMESSVSICAEVLLSIHHNLLSNCEITEIKRLYSKPEVFSQCRNWLSSTMPDVDIVQAASTAAAAQRAAQEPGSAAIGSKLAAEIYDLQMVCENIEDNPNNVTRFFVIGRESARPTGDDKTAMVFSTADKAGALVDVLQVFRNNDINLTDIESRPSKKREQEYYFFADGQGHQNDKKMQEAIKEARKHCLKLSILGSFPRATEVL